MIFDLGFAIFSGPSSPTGRCGQRPSTINNRK
jgi:hypothetical protein